ncbi:MAG: hypothetical protein AABZ11_00330, partial [Nitrospinota bacterium]
MTSLHRIKTKEIDSPIEMGRSFFISIVFHVLLIILLFFSPRILHGKKVFRVSTYRVRLVDLPKKERIGIPVGMPNESMFNPHHVTALEGPVKSMPSEQMKYPQLVAKVSDNKKTSNFKGADNKTETSTKKLIRGEVMKPGVKGKIRDVTVQENYNAKGLTPVPYKLEKGNKSPAVLNDPLQTQKVEEPAKKLEKIVFPEAKTPLNKPEKIIETPKLEKIV